MDANKKRAFQCDVVNEEVQIRLRKKPTGGLRSQSAYFVQCDQLECQHVEHNAPPCPLDRALFEEEIQAREESARRRRGE